MATSAYLTSRTSNSAGLSAVAYGSSDYFYYVNNQFIFTREYRDLYRSRPSQLFFDSLVDVKEFEDNLVNIFADDDIVRINKQLYPFKFKQRSFERQFIDNFGLALDNLTEYQSSFLIIINAALESLIEYKKEELSKVGSNLNDKLIANTILFRNIDKFFKIILNSPMSKIYDLPDNQIIELRDSLDKLQYNWKGLNTNLAEITINEWEQGYLYRNISDIRNSGVNATDHILACSVDYSQETLDNPEQFNGINLKSISEKDLDVLETYQPSIFSTSSQIADRFKRFSLIGVPSGIVSL